MSTAPTSAALHRLLGKLDGLRDRVLPLVAGLAVLAGLLLLWQAWADAQAENQMANAGAQRERVAQALSESLGQLRERVGSAAGNPAVGRALAAGDREAARAALDERLSGAEARLFDPGLAEAFADDPGGFGFSRIEVLHAARMGEDRPLRVIGSGETRALGVAARIEHDGRLVGLALVQFPFTAIDGPLSGSAAGLDYVDVRVGVAGASDVVLRSRGDAALRAGASAELTPVPGTPLRVAGAVARPSRALDYPPMVVVALGLLSIALGAGLLWQWRRGQRQPTAADAPTLEQVLQSQPAQPAPVRPVVVAQVVERNAARGEALDRTIFRAYDIRGVVGVALSAPVAELIGQAIGSELHDRGLREIVVGRDGRLTSPELSDALILGLRRAGCDVIDIGLAPTPLVYFGTYHLGAGSGVAVTGSHNPPDYNGFKVVIGGEALHGDAIQALYARIAEDRLFTAPQQGGLQLIDITRDYVSRISGDLQLERRLKVVVDCGNGAAGVVAQPVLESVGAEVVPLYCEVDGSFPNHHPDPSDPANLRDLATTVKQLGADLGIAFDGDGDRLGVVTRAGDIVFADRLLMLFAQDILTRAPGAVVVYDVKCTGHLAGHVLRHGGSPVMWKTGHSLIKAKMRELDAELGGEMSGHFFFQERWFGFDDGVYAAARLLEILAADPRTPAEVFAELPSGGAGTPELKVDLPEGAHYALIERFREKAQFDGAKLTTIDGVRADWPDGFGLVRASNTTPALVLRFDADSADALVRIQDAFRAQLLALDPTLHLPF